MENNFVFTDLSTYNLEVAKSFYGELLDWHYMSDDSGYLMATFGNKEVSGLYETPQRFKDMKMPSFWMSYIQVDSVDDTVRKAKELGGIVELVDKEQPIGKVALIRDTLGAGFTVYEGDLLNARFANEPNALVWNELFVSSFATVKPFYEGIFNWSFAAAEDQRYLIQNTRQEKIGAIQEVGNDVKGKKEYWGVFFGVEDIPATKAKALANGGTLVYEDGTITALADPFGAFFHLVPLADGSVSGSLESASTTPGNIRWKAMLGLALIAISVLTSWTWIWGVFFTLWVMADLRSGYTHLFEPISREEHPALYWLIVVIWGVLGLYSLVYYARPEWFIS
ncbi:MAG: VOC family protein [Bacteroidota bacterium]